MHAVSPLPEPGQTFILDLKQKEGTTLDVRAVSESLKNTDDLLRSLDEDFEAIHHITSLVHGSAQIGIQANSSVVEKFEDGLRSLREEPILPKGWQEKSLQHVIELYRIAKTRRLHDIKFEIDGTISTIDEALKDSAWKAKSSPLISYGDVSGLLFRYANINGNPEGSLKNYLTEKTVKITMKKEKSQLIKENLDKFVTIGGEIRRNPQDDSLISIALDTLEVWSDRIIPIEEITNLYSDSVEHNSTEYSSDALVRKIRDLWP